MTATPKKKQNIPAGEKFAVIETGGKQYLVEPGMVLKVEKLPAPEKGKTIKFDKVLLLSDKNGLKIGNPFVKGASVSVEIEEEGRNKKVTTLKYHAKTRYRVKKGHRQPYTKVKVK